MNACSDCEWCCLRMWTVKQCKGFATVNIQYLPIVHTALHMQNCAHWYPQVPTSTHGYPWAHYSYPRVLVSTLFLPTSSKIHVYFHYFLRSVAEGRNHYTDNVCILWIGVWFINQTSIHVAEGRNHYTDNVCILRIGIWFIDLMSIQAEGRLVPEWLLWRSVHLHLQFHDLKSKSIR